MDALVVPSDFEVYGEIVSGKVVGVRARVCIPVAHFPCEAINKGFETVNKRL